MEMDLGNRDIVIDNILFLQFVIFLPVSLILKLIEIPGMDLGDFTAQPARLEILQAGEESSLAEVTVAEGKFHQVKRMFAAAGHEVTGLHRRRFGPLELDGSLREGEWREVTEEELSLLYEAAGMEKET